jgi:3-mercaptopropionate dioxygenase
MTSTALDEFIAVAAVCTKRFPEPADCVVALASLKFGLVSRADDFLERLHYRSDPPAMRAT